MILADFDFCPYCGVCVITRPTGDPFAAEAAPSETPEPSCETVSSRAPEESASVSPKNSREGLVLLERLIRDLETMDAEIADMEIHKL